MDIAYPFTIFKNANDEKCVNEPLIHLNTLAQICFRASTQATDFPMPHLLILDPQAVEGVSQSGRFEIDFTHSYLKKIGEIDSFISKENGYRLGLIHKEMPSEEQVQVIESYQNAILLHGELKVTLQKKKVRSKETTIQWITVKEMIR
ncbi:hypothetical protein E2R51_12240 [Jeotgalibacillus sp. S-D1]|uniref:hypothetical protein n=1 Tax=Jeotgalibacillus sp. S-D1 TaxID=2552189 RepID=UPI0010D8D889|nr:hypothetical protein [Jeotgalibacillus sp. S-D1]TDL31978.1 hypothetical protein E2R51_12240 [Jeotgalibacillus sp. S-D1]